MQSGLFSGHLPSLNRQAVVTAGNEALRGGGGAGKAVYRTVGPELASCQAGDARIPSGFHLVESHVIHVDETKMK